MQWLVAGNGFPPQGEAAWATPIKQEAGQPPLYYIVGAVPVYLLTRADPRAVADNPLVFRPNPTYFSPPRDYPDNDNIGLHYASDMRPCAENICCSTRRGLSHCSLGCSCSPPFTGWHAKSIAAARSRAGCRLAGRIYAAGDLPSAVWHPTIFRQRRCQRWPCGCWPARCQDRLSADRSFWVFSSGLALLTKIPPAPLSSFRRNCGLRLAVAALSRTSYSRWSQRVAGWLDWSRLPSPAGGLSGRGVCTVHRWV